MNKLILLPLALLGLSGCVAYGVPYGYGEVGYTYSQPAPHHGGHYGGDYRGGHRDRDRDGVANRYDRDRDGDGIANRDDRRPNDRRRP